MQPGLLPLDTGEVDRGRRLEARETEKGRVDAEAAFGNLVGRLAADAEGQDDQVVSEGAIGLTGLRIVSSLMWAKRPLGKESEDWKRIRSWRDGKWKRTA